MYRRIVPSTRWDTRRGVRKEASIIYCALAFLFGVAGIQLLAHLPPVNWFFLLFLVAIPFAIRWPRLIPVPFLLLGMAWTVHYARDLLDQFVPADLENRTLTVNGRITDLPQHQQHNLRFKFEITGALYRQRTVELPRLAVLSLYQNKQDNPWDPVVGSHWQLQVRLKNPHGFQNPGGFDYEAYLFSQHVRATGYIVPKSGRLYLGQDTRAGFNSLRQHIRNKLQNALTDSSQTGILGALAIGDKQGISLEQRKIFRNTGTSHLLAISGLHLGLVSGLIFLLARIAWSSFPYGARRLPAQRFAIIPAMVSAFVYSGLAGFSIPTQRALVMLTALYLAILFGRQTLRLQALALAMLAVLFYDPLSVLSPGFWLSFGAVAIIFFIVTWQRNTGYWMQGIRVQAAVSFGLIPLLLFFFQSASLVSPLANVVAVPLYGLVVVPLTLTGLASLAIFPNIVGTAMLQIAANISEQGVHWLEWLNALPVTAVHAAAPSAALVLLATAGMALMVMPKGTPFRFLGPFLCLPMFWPVSPPPFGEFRATLLDVGQGLSLVVRTRLHTLVFDTGARFSDRLNAGEAVVVPFLRQNGVSSVDTLIISHDDNDHIGGTNALRAAVRIDQLVSNVPQALPTEPCTKGREWQWDGVQFEILHPHAGAGGGNNNDSCVLMVRSSRMRLLIPGDIEKAAELRLVKEYGERLRSNILIAPHHGSRTSSSEPFLDAVGPSWVLVPAGYLNRYHHPSPSVIRRYAKSGIRWQVSGKQGALIVDSSEADPVPRGYRYSHEKYWWNARPNPD